MFQSAVGAVNFALKNAENAKHVKEFFHSDDVLPENMRTAMKDSMKHGVQKAGSLVRHPLHGLRHHEETPGTTALRSVGLSIKDKGGKKLGPTSQYVNNPRSGTEMMEGIVNTLKQAYYPVQINVATWDAALKLDTMTCCGLTEYGTAKSANGLEYRFAVFRGAGQMHWTGSLSKGIPDAGCSGNIRMSPDSIWFWNTDMSADNVQHDLVKLLR